MLWVLKRYAKDNGQENIYNFKLKICVQTCVDTYTRNSKT